MELTTLIDVKALLGGSVSDADDETIKFLIGGVSAEFELYLNRLILEKERTEQIDIKCGQWRIYLPAYPIVSIANIWNDTTRVFAAGSLIAAADYYLDNELGRVIFDKTSLVYGPGSLKVQYTGGMAATVELFRARFPDISNACATEVAYRYQRRGTIGLVNSTVGGNTVTIPLPGQFLESVAMVLDQYSRAPVAV